MKLSIWKINYKNGSPFFDGDFFYIQNKKIAISKISHIILSTGLWERTIDQISFYFVGNKSIEPEVELKTTDLLQTSDENHLPINNDEVLGKISQYFIDRRDARHLSQEDFRKVNLHLKNLEFMECQYFLGVPYLYQDYKGFFGKIDTWLRNNRIRKNRVLINNEVNSVTFETEGLLGCEIPKKISLNHFICSVYEHYGARQGIKYELNTEIFNLLEIKGLRVENSNFYGKIHAFEDRDKNLIYGCKIYYKDKNNQYHIISETYT